MQLISHCGQFYSYAVKDQIPCGGNVHELTVQREICKEPQIFSENLPMNVCDAHMPSFEELAKRESYLLRITGDRIIGEIAPQSIEGKSPTTERE